MEEDEYEEDLDEEFAGEDVTPVEEPEPELNTLSDYNELLQKYVKQWRFHQVPIRFEQLKQKGLTPDMTTYKTVVEALSFQGKTQELENIKEEMAKNGLKIDSQIYNLLLKGYNLVGTEFDIVWKLFEEMQNNQVKIDLPVLNSLIDACGFHGKLNEMTKIFEEASSKFGLVPDEDTHRALIEAYMRNAEFVKATDHIEKLRDQNQLTYKICRAFLMKDPRFLDAEAELAELESEGEFDVLAEQEDEEPTPLEMWRHLKESFFGKSGTLSEEDDEAFDQFLEMQMLGYNPRMSEALYTTAYTETDSAEGQKEDTDASSEQQSTDKK